ncbi:MAG: hypothetical protein ACYSUC_01240 [Planctomycetota bacterium]|jgi:hypothetical protein
MRKRSALSAFRFENGYTFSATDLGNQGVKVELAHEHQNGGAIILPPAKAQEYAKWILRTIAQREHNSLKELPDILKRLMQQKAIGRMLQRGDKKKIREALRLLKTQHS